MFEKKLETTFSKTYELPCIGRDHSYITSAWEGGFRKYLFLLMFSTAQSCDLTNFSILGDFAQKMADISDFKKTPHYICLKLNQINFSGHFLLLSSH